MREIFQIALLLVVHVSIWAVLVGRSRLSELLFLAPIIHRGSGAAQRFLAEGTLGLTSASEHGK